MLNHAKELLTTALAILTLCGRATESEPISELVDIVWYISALPQ
jgi:hypothetical protein